MTDTCFELGSKKKRDILNAQTEFNQMKEVMLEQKANYGTVTLKVGGADILFKAT